MAVKPIPDGYHTVTPYLIVDDVAGLVSFLEEAFDAEETFRMAGADGSVSHAEMRIGDSMVMMGQASEAAPAMPVMLHLYVENSDEVYRQAVAAGATSVREPADEFYGDRTAGVVDRFGNQWWLATHVEDVPFEEMQRRAAAREEQ